MLTEFDALDFIALTTYTLYLGGVASGLLIWLRTRGKRRLLGVLLLGEAVVAAALLTLMSSHYWITGGEGIIGLGLKPLAMTVGTVLFPLVVGCALIAAVGYFVFRLAKSRYRMLGLVLLVWLLPLIFAVSTTELVALTELHEQSKPKLPDPEQGDIKITAGFTVTIFSHGPAHNPTSIALGPDQRLYVADYNGDIWAYAISHGQNNTPTRYASGFYEPVGLTWRGNVLYVAQHGKVTTIRGHDGRAGEMQDIITNLPTRIYPWHSNNGIVFGPDGRMYFGVGSTTDWSPETYKYAASILSANPDGSDLRVFATGVRNPYRLAFNAAGDLFATDNGPDRLEVTPGDKLYQIVEGGDYGFAKYIDQPPPGSGSRGPVAVFPPHASADGIVFYHGSQFPQEYYDNAFVTLWHRGEIYRVQLTKSPTGDYLAKLSMFASGFKNPLDLVVTPDGSLYLVEFTKSAIYRIATHDAPLQSAVPGRLLAPVFH